MGKTTISRKKRVVIAFILILIQVLYYGGRAVINTGIFDSRYSSVEEALDKNIFIKGENVEYIMRSGDFAMTYYQEPGKETRCEFLCKDEKGWHFATQKFNLPLQNRLSSRFLFHRGSYHSKNIFYIIKTAQYGVKGIEVSDSEGSEFAYHEYEQQGFIIYFWLLCLEEIPDNYYITINGERFDISK